MRIQEQLEKMRRDLEKSAAGKTGSATLDRSGSSCGSGTKLKPKRSFSKILSLPFSRKCVTSQVSHPPASVTTTVTSSQISVSVLSCNLERVFGVILRARFRSQTAGCAIDMTIKVSKSMSCLKLFAPCLFFYYNATGMQLCVNNWWLVRKLISAYSSPLVCMTAVGCTLFTVLQEIIRKKELQIPHFNHSDISVKWKKFTSCVGNTHRLCWKCSFLLL